MPINMLFFIQIKLLLNAKQLEVIPQLFLQWLRVKLLNTLTMIFCMSLRLSMSYSYLSNSFSLYSKPRCKLVISHLFIHTKTAKNHFQPRLFISPQTSL